MTRVGVIGAGAIGGWIAASLARGGHSVGVLARGTTLAAIRHRGLTLENDAGQVRVEVNASDDAADLGRQDIVFLAVKSPILPAIATMAAPMIAPDTIIVPLLNGVPWWFMGKDAVLRSVDPQGLIAEAFRYDQLVGSVVHASASCPSPGHVQLRMADRLILGEPGGGHDERVASLVQLLGDAGVPAVASDNIRHEIWYKLWGNMTMNPISALTLATADQILDDPLVVAFILGVMAEAKAIGAGVGCRIEQSGEDRNAVTRKLGAFKTSMLQDVEAGRQLEIDALLSAPQEIARGMGMPTPSIDALLGLSRLMGRSRSLY